jgi:hypothetical protein
MITQEELKELLSYDQDTGIFTWNKSKKQAGTLTYSGYKRIIIKNKSYYAHRLVWLYVNGYMPDYVDHINMNRSDNRLCNLRKATNAENQCNKKITKNNTSGVKGVSWFARDNNWRARIQFDGKHIHLGYFNTIEEAKTAIENTRVELHREFANHG